MNLFEKFKRKTTVDNKQYQYLQMLNGSAPVFTQFGENIYASDVVQQAIGCVVREMKKLIPRHIRKANGVPEEIDDSINQVLKNPNEYMTTSDFIEKCCWLLYFQNNVFIYPQYSDKRTLEGLYPLSPSEVEFLEDNSGNQYIRMRFSGGYAPVFPRGSVIHWKMNYSVNDLMGGNDNGRPNHTGLLETLKINHTLLQSISKVASYQWAVNGVIKYNGLVGMKELEQSRREFEERLRNNESGILPLDAKGEYIPLTRDLKLIDKDTLEFIDSKILRNFGVPLPILSGDYTKTQYEAFYQKTLEDKVISLSQAFTKTLFSPIERKRGNEIIFYPKELLFMTVSEKLELIRLLGDSGALYENEKRDILGLPPDRALNGVRNKSLNYVNVDIANEYQLNNAGAKKEEESDGQVGDAVLSD